MASIPPLPCPIGWERSDKMSLGNILLGYLIGTATATTVMIATLEYLDKYMNLKGGLKIAKLAKQMRDKVKVEEDIKEMTDLMDTEDKKTALKRFGNIVSDMEHEKQETIPGPDEVLEEGKADCVGRSILFASLAESIGVDTQFAFQDGHVFVLIHRKVDSPGIEAFGCGEGEITFVE